MLNDKTCRSTDWFTPPEILGPVRAYFGGQIELDPATTPGNPTEAEYFLHCDGLQQPWARNRVFVNPPYGKELKFWVEKIGFETMMGAWVVALLPGQRLETPWFQECIFTKNLTAMVLVRGRVKFLRPDGSRGKSNPYGSALYVFNGNSPERIQDCFGRLGKVLQVKEVPCTT